MIKIIQFVNLLFIFLYLKFFQNRSVFNSLEEILIQEVLDRLDVDLKCVLRDQLSEINYVQRILGREVNMYKIGFGRVLERSSRKLRTMGEFVLKKGDIVCNGKCMASFEFIVIDGYFFSIQFDRDVSFLANREDIDIVI